MWNERTLEKPHAKMTPAVRGENFSGRAASKQVRIRSILMIPQYYKSYLLQNKSYSLAHRGECLLFSGHLLADHRSVILPSIIQIKATRPVLLVKIDARFFPWGI